MLHGECLSHFVSPFCLNKWWIEKAKKHNSYNKESNERVKKKKITKIEKEQTERGVWKNPLTSAFRQPPIIVLSWSCESAHIALYVAKSPTVDIYTQNRHLLFLQKRRCCYMAIGPPKNKWYQYWPPEKEWNQYCISIIGALVYGNFWWIHWSSLHA